MDTSIGGAGPVVRFGRTEQTSYGTVWALYEALERDDWRGGQVVAWFVRHADAVAFMQGLNPPRATEADSLREENARLQAELDRPKHETLRQLADAVERNEHLKRERDEAIAFLRRASSGPKEIVSTGLLTEQQIANYRAAGLMYVEPGGGLGWVVRERRVLEMADAEVARLRDLLGWLVDLQNGCPLPKYEEDWNRVMDAARAALAGVQGEMLSNEARKYEVELAALREENARLREDALPDVVPEDVDQLRRERDEARAERDAVSGGNALMALRLADAVAEVSRLEGLILDWRVASFTGNSHEYQLAAEALGGEGERIRAQREEGR